MVRTRGWQQTGGIAGGAYERNRDLPRLALLWPAELADTSVVGRRKILALLERALRAERRRGLAGSWSYDLGRHRALVIATQAEREALLQATRQGRSRGMIERADPRSGQVQPGRRPDQIQMQPDTHLPY